MPGVCRVFEPKTALDVAVTTCCVTHSSNSFQLI